MNYWFQVLFHWPNGLLISTFPLGTLHYHFTILLNFDTLVSKKFYHSNNSKITPYAKATKSKTMRV